MTHVSASDMPLPSVISSGQPAANDAMVFEYRANTMFSQQMITKIQKELCQYLHCHPI